MSISVYPSVRSVTDDNANTIDGLAAGNVHGLQVADHEVRNKLSNMLTYIKALCLHLEEITGESVHRDAEETL